MFRKSEAIRKHQMQRLSQKPGGEEAEAVLQEDNGGGQGDKSASNFLDGEEQVEGRPKSRLSDFPPELFRSAQSHTGHPNLVLDGQFSEEDIEAYNNNEGREYFVNRTEMRDIEQKTQEVQAEIREAHNISCVVRDYNLDSQQTPEEINAKLTFVTRGQKDLENQGMAD